MKINKVNGFSGIVFLGCLLLSGCQGTSNAPAKTNPSSNTSPRVMTQSSNSVESAVTEKTNKVALCQSELASLKKVSPNAYLERKAYFDSLLSSVSVYASVRGDVNAKTKDTLDALYKYKTNQVCAEIERDVLQGLIGRGESLK